MLPPALTSLQELLLEREDGSASAAVLLEVTE